MSKVTVDLYRKGWFGWKWVNAVTIDRDWAARAFPEGEYQQGWRAKWRKDTP